MPVVPIAPPKVRRFFGIDKDVINAASQANGGTDYDTLTNVGASPSNDIPDVAIPWPATAADTAWNETRVDRSAEVRGHRALSAPLPIGAVPSITATLPAYRAVAEILLKGVMGKEGSVTGSAPGPYTHPLSVLDYTDGTVLPTYLLQIVRDLLHHKACGAVIDSVNWTLPIGAESTIDVTAHAKYMRQEASSATYPSPNNSALGFGVDPLMLRDVKVYFDGGAATSLAINSVTFGIANNIDTSPERVFIAGHNIESKTVGTGGFSRATKLQFPTFFRLSGGHSVTYSIAVANADDVQELAAQWGQVQKIVTEIGGGPIAGASANELVRITKYATEWDTANPDALAARGDIGQALSGSAYYSASDGTDILVEVVNGISTTL